MSIHKHYKISSDGELIRLNQFCPRCGPGYFMANNYDRLTCGQCGYTEFKKKGPKKGKAAEEAKTKGAAKGKVPAKGKKKTKTQ
ncbi:MAG: 30S ribosomal protein S27ae [Candidatus Helarchaeota archaeon]|nr:30S ribosomal protein S27ae [Candidatus Helarchaeota archaeon]